MNNEDVIREWMRGGKATNGRGSLSTSGGRLYSYKLLIGDHSDGFVIYDHTARGDSFHSQTTSKHVGLALRFSRGQLKKP